MKKLRIHKHTSPNMGGGAGWALHIPIARKYFTFPTWEDAVAVATSAKLFNELGDWNDWSQGRGMYRKWKRIEGPANLPTHLRKRRKTNQ